MSLKKDKVNPLNVLNLRKVEFPAHHFVYKNLTINNTINGINKIDKWIYLNLKGRYYIGSTLELINNIIVYTLKVGFEEEKELMIFNLVCQDLVK